MSSWIGPLIDIYSAIQTVWKAQKDIERVSVGEDPFAGPKKYQDALNNLKKAARDLDDLPGEVWRPPREHRVSIEALRTPAGKADLVDNLETRLAFQADVQETLDRLIEVETEAQARSRAARELAQRLKKMIELPLPLPTTAFQAQFLELSELAQRGAGQLGSVARAAARSRRLLEPQMGTYKIGTDNLRSNLRTFDVL